MNRFVTLLLLTGLLSCGKSDSPTPGNGVGGSTARFTLAGTTLYTLSDQYLQTYDLRTGTPVQGPKQQLGLGLETLFPYGQHLFVGTRTGMFILSLAQPSAPKQVGYYSHMLSCDPVVVQGSYAYVTLRSGTTCRSQGPSSLDIIDISIIEQPKLVKSYPMTSPHGLGVYGTTLFVGEGDKGLRIMDISNPLNAKTVQYLTDVKSYDVIPLSNVLIVTGPDGVYQYSYADPTQLKLLSKISLTP